MALHQPAAKHAPSGWHQELAPWPPQARVNQCQPGQTGNKLGGWRKWEKTTMDKGQTGFPEIFFMFYHVMCYHVFFAYFCRSLRSSSMGENQNRKATGPNAIMVSDQRFQHYVCESTEPLDCLCVWHCRRMARQCASHVQHLCLQSDCEHHFFHCHIGWFISDHLETYSRDVLLCKPGQRLYCWQGQGDPLTKKNLTATSRTASEAFGRASEICWKGRLLWSEACCVFLKQIVQAPSPHRTGISVFPEDGSTRGIAVGSPQTWFITLVQDSRPTHRESWTTLLWTWCFFKAPSSITKHTGWRRVRFTVHTGHVYLSNSLTMSPASFSKSWFPV